MQWSVPPIGEIPHQLMTFRFPQRELGQRTVTKRSFQAKWFSRWPWLHYNSDFQQTISYMQAIATDHAEL